MRLLKGDSVARHNYSIQGESRLGAIPVNEFADRVVIRSFNADGTVNLCGDTLYGVWGQTPGHFAYRIDPVTLAVSVEGPPNSFDKFTLPPASLLSSATQVGISSHPFGSMAISMPFKG